VIWFDFDFFAKKIKIKPNHISLARSFQGGATIWDAPEKSHLLPFFLFIPFGVEKQRANKMCFALDKIAQKYLFYGIVYLENYLQLCIMVLLPSKKRFLFTKEKTSMNN
jgi:hypothetical protein